MIAAPLVPTPPTDLEGAVAALPAHLEGNLAELDRTFLDPFEVVSQGYDWLVAQGP